MLPIGRHVSRLSGYAPALPTPFRDDDTIDGAAFEKLCELQITAGAAALVVCGTTGEAPTLTAPEQRQLVGMAVKIARGRVPVIAGAGSNSTAHAIELTRDAEAAGADAILSVVPYYNKPTQAGMHAHFSAIAQSTGLPIILYDVPSRTVCGLADETVARLAEIPRIIGLKDATGDVTRPGRLRSLVGPDFRLLSGDDATALAFFIHGGDGCISVTSNLVPGLCREMFLVWKHNQTARAQGLGAALGPLTHALFCESSPVPLKYALSLLKLISPNVRLPLVAPAEATKSQVAGAIAQVDQCHTEYLIGNVAWPERFTSDLPLPERERVARSEAARQERVTLVHQEPSPRRWAATLSRKRERGKRARDTE